MLKVDWDDMEDATGYELEYHHYDIEWLRLPHAPLNYDAHFNGSLALVDGLGTQTGYTFRVRAVNDDRLFRLVGHLHQRVSRSPTCTPRTRPNVRDSKARPRSRRACRYPPPATWRSRFPGTRHRTRGTATSPDTEWSSRARTPRSGTSLTTTTDTSYTHKELSPGRTFYYRTSAFNDRGRGQNTGRARGTSTAHPDKPRWEPAIHKVPDDWEPLPEGVDWKHGDRFRLMFITSEARGANSANIDDYNDFVQQAAAGGHDAIQEYSSDFRVLASTLAIDAVDNTGTNWSEDDRGVPLYWLQGTRVAG